MEDPDPPPPPGRMRKFCTFFRIYFELNSDPDNRRKAGGGAPAPYISTKDNTVYRLNIVLRSNVRYIYIVLSNTYNHAVCQRCKQVIVRIFVVFCILSFEVATFQNKPLQSLIQFTKIFFNY